MSFVFITPCFFTDCGQAYEVPIQYVTLPFFHSPDVYRLVLHVTLIDMRAHVVSCQTLCVTVPNGMNAKASLSGVYVHFPCAEFVVQDLFKSVIIVDILPLSEQRPHGFHEVVRYYLLSSVSMVFQRPNKS